MARFGIKQHDIRDCGAACLASICRYYGVNIPLVKMREQMKVNKNGSSLYAIAQTAEYYNLDAEVMNGTWEELMAGIKTQELILPLIVHLAYENFGHYIIIMKVYNEKIKIFDPAKGICLWQKEELKKRWTGYIILLKKGRNFQSQNLEKGFLLKYWEIFKKQKYILMYTLCISLFLSGIALISAWAYQRIIDSFILGGQKTYFNYSGSIKPIIIILRGINNVISHFHYFFMTLVIIYIIQMILNILKGYFISKISNQVSQELINLFLEKIFHLPLSFFEDRETGEIISRFSDIGEIKQLIAQGGISIIINIFMVFVGGAILCDINLLMFLMVLFIILIYAIIVLIYKKPINCIKQDIFEGNSQVMTRLKESIDNIESVKNICGEENEKIKLKKIASKTLEKIYKGEIISKTQNAFLQNIEAIGSIFILWFGSYLVINKQLSLGDLIVFESMLGFFLSPFQQLIGMQIELQGAFIAMDRLNDILEIQKEDDIYRGIDKPELKYCDIIYDEVVFRYNYDKPVLNNINLKLKYGKTYAIIGSSGCGKSTLMRLLVQYYPCESGNIYIGKYKLSNISLKYLREKVKYVSSEGKLFAGSILDNLLMMCNKSIEYKRIDEVISGCNLQEFLNTLPFGINTKVGEGGFELSSGQRQRILLAQALLANPEILIIDEGTSHLDEKNEQEIYQFIKSQCKDITCIFIIHNLFLASACDEILVMDQGKIIAQGTYDNLMKKK